MMKNNSFAVMLTQIKLRIQFALDPCIKALRYIGFQLLVFRSQLCNKACNLFSDSWTRTENENNTVLG